MKMYGHSHRLQAESLGVGPIFQAPSFMYERHTYSSLVQWVLLCSLRRLLGSRQRLYVQRPRWKWFDLSLSVLSVELCAFMQPKCEGHGGLRAANTFELEQYHASLFVAVTLKP